jgi:hypothetical protein
MLNVIMLNIIMLNVITLNVIMLNSFKLSVVVPIGGAYPSGVPYLKIGTHVERCPETNALAYYTNLKLGQQKKFYNISQ